MATVGNACTAPAVKSMQIVTCAALVLLIALTLQFCVDGDGLTGIELVLALIVSGAAWLFGLAVILAAIIVMDDNSSSEAYLGATGGVYASDSDSDSDDDRVAAADGDCDTAGDGGSDANSQSCSQPCSQSCSQPCHFNDSVGPDDVDADTEEASSDDEPPTPEIPYDSASERSLARSSPAFRATTPQGVETWPLVGLVDKDRSE